MLRQFLFTFTILSLGISILFLLIVLGYFIINPFIGESYYPNNSGYPYLVMFFITIVYNFPKIIRAFYRAIVKDKFDDLDKFE